MNFDATVTGDPGAISQLSQGTRLNNLALQAEQSGDLLRAENLHLEALTIKETGPGSYPLSAAVSQNALGELYIKLGRLDDAETYLRKAIAIRNHAGSAFDAAVSRDNLAQLYELRGDLKQAKETRLYGAPDHLSCGYYHCPGQIFKLSQLSQCGQCKSIYYCSKSCQLQDWKSRHKPLCKAGTA